MASCCQHGQGIKPNMESGIWNELRCFAGYDNPSLISKIFLVNKYTFVGYEQYSSWHSGLGRLVAATLKII